MKMMWDGRMGLGRSEEGKQQQPPDSPISTIKTIIMNESIYQFINQFKKGNLREFSSPYNHFEFVSKMVGN